MFSAMYISRIMLLFFSEILDNSNNKMFIWNNK
jgi:hypothetical protein